MKRAINDASTPQSLANQFLEVKPHGPTTRDPDAPGAITPEEAPRDADQLHAWIADHLGVTLARVPMIEGHAAPFDYVRWAFLESAAPAPTRHPFIPDAVVWANRGGGKTFLGAIATTLELLFLPGIQIRILAGSLDQAGRMHAHLRRFFELPRLSAMIDGRVTEKKLKLKNGSAVELLAQSQTSVRGSRVQKLRCDEVELFDPAVWDAAQLTTRSAFCGDRWVAGSVECLSTLHIPHGLMHRLIAEAREGKRKLFKWGVLDVLDHCGPEHTCEPPDQAPCPLWEECGGRAKARIDERTERAPGHIDVRDAIQMKGRVSLPVWQSEMLCLRPRRDDAVLPEFRPDLHVVRAIPGVDPGTSRWASHDLLWLGGMDFGFRAPTVILWAVLNAENQLWIVDERVRTGCTIAEHAQAIQDSPWTRPAWLGVDPAGNAINDHTGRSTVTALRNEGLIVRSSRVPVARGLDLLRTRLRPAAGEPTLFVHERCVKLIESMERYHYPVNDPHSMEPVKDGPDHAVDALRYLVQNLDRPTVTRLASYL